MLLVDFSYKGEFGGGYWAGEVVEYCCEKIKEAMDEGFIQIPTAGGSIEPDVTTPIVALQYKIYYDDEPDYRYMPIIFCPFCGQFIEITVGE